MELVLDRVLLSPGIYSLEVILGTGRGLVLDAWSYAETLTILPSLEDDPTLSTSGVFFHHPCRWERSITDY
jgi:hypothetical protein